MASKEKNQQAENIAINIDVLSNDDDADGDALTVDSVTQPSNGSVVINPDETVAYTPGPTPTVLAAHFMNGNNAFVNSRVYLWNPSATAGEVTVRVFTLPVVGGISEELTATPFNLGTLGAESARNIRLAEDILAVMGIPLPYTDDGGNLTLEFTIQAPDVQGAAQVFSPDVAFGTYPLQ